MAKDDKGGAHQDKTDRDLSKPAVDPSKISKPKDDGGKHSGDKDKK